MPQLIAMVDDRIRFSKVCRVTKETYEVVVPYQSYRTWRAGHMIQDAMPDLTPDQREFILSGMTPAEFDQLVGEEEWDSTDEEEVF